MKDTSWGGVAEWYNELLEEKPDSYQTAVILPNLLRLLDIKKGEKVLDLACGQGFFAREFAGQGAKVVGADIAKELIALAEKNTPKDLKKKISYLVSAADRVKNLENSSFDKAVIILALQNMEKVNEVLQECARVLKPEGKLFLVLNHPAFRVLKESGWGWDPSVPREYSGPSTEIRAGVKGVQYRRIDKYLSESAVKIQMHPGENPEEKTISFHRPLQFYFKALNKAGFCVNKLEEWNSNKKSGPGPRAEAENRARKEIPLFLCLEAARR